MVETASHDFPPLPVMLLSFYWLLRRKENHALGWVWPLVKDQTPVDSPKPSDMWTKQIELCVLFKKKRSRHKVWWQSMLERCGKWEMGGNYKHILLCMHIFEIPKEHIIKNKIKSIKRKNRKKEGDKWKERKIIVYTKSEYKQV